MSDDPQQPIEAHLADGTVMQFPAGTSSDVVQAAVKRQVAGQPHPRTSQAQPSADAREELLGTIGRYGGLMSVPAGPPGEALGRAMAHPGNWPTLAAAIAAPLTGGGSLLASTAAAAGAGGAGSLAKNAAEYFAGMQKTPSDVAKEVALNAGLQGAAQGVGGVVGKGLEWLAPKLMSGVLKPTVEMQRNNPGMDIPLEAVKQGAVISKGGLARQTAKTDALNQAVNDAIQARGDVTVQPSVAAKSLADLLEQRRAAGRYAAKDTQQIEDALVNFVGRDQPMPLAEAQAGKKYLGEKVGNQIGSQITEPVTVDIEQALRAGTKDAIAQAAPEVDALNEQLAPAIAVRKALARRLPTAENTNPVPARIFMAHNPYVAALSGLTGSPYLGSQAANLMYRTSQVPANALRAALLEQMGTGAPSPP